MKPGEVSDLIPLGKTFTFFRLNDHVPAGKRKFDEVKDKLRTDLQKEKEDRYAPDWTRSYTRTPKWKALRDSRNDRCFDFVLKGRGFTGCGKWGSI